MKEVNKSNRRVIVLVVIMIILVAAGFFVLGKSLKDKNEVIKSEKTAGDMKSEKKPEEVEITIFGAGDILCHMPQVNAARQDDGTYDFNDNYRFVKPYIESADISFCNIETTFLDDKYTGFPIFRSPFSIADAVKNAGFDVVFTASNHSNDSGAIGMKKTLEVIRKAGLETTGTSLPGEKNYIIKEVKGIKIAFIAYTYRSPLINGRPSLNGIVLSDEAFTMLNSFGFEDLDGDLENVHRAIESAKEDGADLVVSYYHWGDEYHREPNSYQRYIAQKTADFGADVIFASHPHAEQPVEVIKSGEREVPVYYALGNFISNQREEILNKRYTEQGAIGRTKFKFKDKKLIGVSFDVLPTWTNLYYKNGRAKYAIIPLDDKFEENDTLNTEDLKKKAKIALEDQKELFGEDKILTLK